MSLEVAEGSDFCFLVLILTGIWTFTSESSRYALSRTIDMEELVVGFRGSLESVLALIKKDRITVAVTPALVASKMVSRLFLWNFFVSLFMTPNDSSTPLATFHHLRPGYARRMK